jgi:hypothetical protein
MLKAASGVQKQAQWGCSRAAIANIAKRFGDVGRNLPPALRT